MNKLFQEMTNQKMSQVGEIASKLKMMSNPQALLNNPQIAQLIKQYGNPKAGVYEVVLNVSGLPSEAGNITINLMKDNVLQSGNSINIPTVVTTQGVGASMTALIKVTTNNSCKCNSSPVSLQFINSGVGLTDANLNVVVTKLC